MVYLDYRKYDFNQNVVVNVTICPKACADLVIRQWCKWRVYADIWSRPVVFKPWVAKMGLQDNLKENICNQVQDSGNKQLNIQTNNKKSNWQLP